MNVASAPASAASSSSAALACVASVAAFSRAFQLAYVRASESRCSPARSASAPTLNDPTGGGLRDEDHQAAASEGNTSEFLKHYIPWGGPNADTPEAAKNLWGALLSSFMLRF